VDAASAAAHAGDTPSAIDHLGRALRLLCNDPELERDEKRREYDDRLLGYLRVGLDALRSVRSFFRRR